MLRKFRFFSAAAALALRVSLFSASSSRRVRSFSTSAAAMGNSGPGKEKVPLYTRAPEPKVRFTEEELRQKLSPDEYRITQQKGTERPGTGPHLKVEEDGVFSCVVCGNKLFETEDKFDSGSGWPSFSDVISKSASVVRVVDETHGMRRVEALCGQCGAHLGHVFDDGPREKTGLRYCINGSCLRFSGSKTGDEQEPPSGGGGGGETDAKIDS